jgi:hypothetical protein
MSSVRMCDKCGDIFSENDEDWSTFSGSVQRRRENGSRYTETVNQDACPPCTAGTKPVKPRVAIAAPFPAEHDPVPLGKPDYERIAELEAEAGITPAPASVTSGHMTAPGGYQGYEGGRL